MNESVGLRSQYLRGMSVQTPLVKKYWKPRSAGTSSAAAASSTSG